MAEEKMEKVMLCEDDLDNVVGGYSRPFTSCSSRANSVAVTNEEVEKLMSDFALDELEHTNRAR